MPLKEIANTDCIIAHDAGSPISGGSFTITSVPSLKVKALSKGVYKGTLTYTFTGGSASGFVNGSVASVSPQTIAPTAIKVKADGSLVIRKDDTGTLNAVGTITPTPPPPAPPTGPVSGPVKISNAGQIKAKAQ